MLIPPKLQPLIAFLFVVSVSIAFLPLLSANIALSQIRRDPNAAEHYVALPLSPQQKHIVGALLLQQNQPAEALKMLRDDGNLRYTSFLAGKAYQELGDPLEAGLAYERAGLFEELIATGNVRQLRALDNQPKVVGFVIAALALAREAERRADYPRAMKFIDFVQTLSTDPENIAETYRIAAVSALASGDEQRATTLVRQSLDVWPPGDGLDPRYAFLQHVAAQRVEENNCQYVERDRLFSLLLIYSSPNDSGLTTCIERLTDSALSRLPVELHPFLLLRKAMAALGRENVPQATSLLDLAEAAGLPVAWSRVLRVANDDVAEKPVGTPTFPVSHDQIIGYEVDPIQVELGLPLDLILFYRKGTLAATGSASAQDADLLLYQAINLAPNPGFEYEALEPCPQLDCVPPGFERHVYSGPVASKLSQIVRIERPFLPNNPDMLYTSNALQLINTEAPDNVLQHGGFNSFLRPVLPKASYLQAGWIKSGGGNGFYGRLWELSGQRTSYNYVVAGYTSDEWMYASQVVIPPPDAEAMKAWTLNFDSAGDVYFDGLLMVRLPN